MLHERTFEFEVRVHWEQFSEKLNEVCRVVLQLQDPQNHCERCTVNVVSTLDSDLNVCVVESGGVLTWLGQYTILRNNVLTHCCIEI